MLAHILYDEVLFATIRAEVNPIVKEGTEDFGQKLEQCAHLEAVYHEASRLVASSITTRTVIEPFQLGGKLLHPGCRLLAPYRQLHIDEEVYGNDVRQFNFNRFLKNKDLSRSPSFKPFGGGTTYCPGRFLARREVLTFIAIALVRFDISLSVPNTNFDAEGKVMRPRFPRVEEKKYCLAIMSPKMGDDLILNVSERDMRQC